MGLLTKPIEAARKNRDACLEEAERWERKAQAMRAEASELDQSANDAILEDESAAERITVAVTTLQRKAHAYDEAARKARTKADAAARELLSVEADELDKEAEKIRKAADKHDVEVAKAKAALESLDECQYTRLVEEQDWDPVDAKYRRTVYHHGKSHVMRRTALHLSTQAQVIRYWLTVGEVPKSLKDLNERLSAEHDLANSWTDGAPINRYGEALTDNLREAVSAREAELPWDS
ncbi:hypothetical protein GCM10027417_24070 [Glutamicibacter endophyticus]